MGKALIIGASGGIGRALVAERAARGDAVTALSRSENGFDVRDGANVDRLLGALNGPFQTICVATGLLAPLGHMPEKQLARMDADVMAEVFAVNTIGTANILRHLPRLLPKSGRSVAGVLTARVGSIADNHLGGWHAYRASKAAANMLIRGAAVELARTHPDAIVIALHPGTVATSFTENYAASHNRMPPEKAARMLCDVMDHRQTDQSGGFYDYAGASIPW